jgi:hypothetical protein
MSYAGSVGLIEKKHHVPNSQKCEGKHTHQSQSTPDLPRFTALRLIFSFKRRTFSARSRLSTRDFWACDGSVVIEADDAEMINP